MNKQKIKEIVKFSIKQNIQNKWFVGFNVLLLILMILFANAGNIREFLENNNIQIFDDEVSIEYVDPNNIIDHKLERMFAKNDKVTVKKVAENKYTPKNIKDNVLIIEVDKDEAKIIKVKITSKEGFDNVIYDDIVEVLQECRSEVFAQTLNIPEEKLEILSTEIPIDRVMLSVNAENSEQKQAIQLVSTIVVYMISIFIFSKIANEIANEKVSKSIEYVLTSVTAKEYLLAKIISVTAVVLIQAVFTLVYYMMGNLISTAILMLQGYAPATSAQQTLSALDADVVLYICTLFIYSVLTLILLSIIQAALSSKTTNMSEAGNSMTFLLVITVAVYMFTFALINPYTNMSAFIYILSCIPLISNYFVPAIMIIGQAKAWQIIVSLVLLVISIPVAFNKCSKIFKNGVLDYSEKRPKKHKVRKELTLKEEQALKLEKSKFKSLALVLGLSMIIALVLQILLQVLLDVLAYPVFIKFMNKEQIKFLTMGLVSMLSLAGAYLFVKVYTKKDEVKEAPNYSVVDCLKMLATSLVFTGLLQWIIIYAQAHWGFRNTAVYETLNVPGLDNFVLQIFFIVAIAIIPAVFEELFFRKGLINLTREYGDKFAIVVSSLLFAVIHLNLAQGIFAFFMGIILGTLYVKTGKLRYGMILHGINNAYAVFCQIFGSCNWDIAYNTVIYIGKGLFYVSILIVILEIIRKIRAKEKLVIPEGKVIPANSKYILTDYTFILGAIFVAVTFCTTEIMLNML